MFDENQPEDHKNKNTKKTNRHENQKYLKINFYLLTKQIENANSLKIIKIYFWKIFNEVSTRWITSKSKNH